MYRILLFLFLIVSLNAQTTLLVSGPSTGWTPLTVSPDQTTTNFLADPLSDQQTGQSPDDFVGTSTVAGMFIDRGTVNGVASIGFRAYMAGYQPSGYTGNVRFGMDVNQDGAVDLFFGPKLSGNANSQGIVFQIPTGPGNYSPSTTNLGNPYNRIAFTTNNYSYLPLNATLDPSWVTIGPNTNAAISIDFPVQTLTDLFAAIGFTYDASTYFAIIAFTSTQSNAINQDLYGSTGINNDVRFDAPGGGFTDFYSADGGFKKRPIIPEPSTYGAIFIGVALSLLFLKKKLENKKR